MNEKLQRLCDKARERMRSGELPDRMPAATWGGQGDGRCCAVCETVVTAVQPQVEFELGQLFRMHVSCFTAWESVVTGDLHAERGDHIISSRESEASIRGSG